MTLLLLTVLLSLILILCLTMLLTATKTCPSSILMVIATSMLMILELMRLLGILLLWEESKRLEVEHMPIQILSKLRFMLCHFINIYLQLKFLHQIIILSILFQDSCFLKLEKINIDVFTKLLFIVKLLNSLASFLLLHIEYLGSALASSAIKQMAMLQLYILDLTILLADLFKPLFG